MKKSEEDKKVVEIAKEAFKEASFLRSEITEEEKDRLNFSDLSPSQKSQCIYGLISGYCFNERASELINKSKINLNKGLTIKAILRIGGGFTSIDAESRRYYSLFSPLESIIMNFDTSFNEKLINFLKGDDVLVEQDFVTSALRSWE